MINSGPSQRGPPCRNAEAENLALGPGTEPNAADAFCRRVVWRSYFGVAPRNPSRSTATSESAAWKME
jgi:hypothetical protein